MRGSLGVAIVATVAALAPAAGAAVAATDVRRRQQQAVVAGIAELLLQPGGAGGFAGHAGPQGLGAEGVRPQVRRGRQGAPRLPARRPGRSRAARRWRTRPARARGRSPARSTGMPSVQHARLLVIPVEFNPNANDDFSGFERYDADDPSGCVTEPAGTVFNGPMHNQIPNPAHDRARQQHAVGAGLQPGLLQQAHLLHPGHHQEGAPGPQRRREPQGPDRPQLLPGDLQGPVRPRPAA